VQEFSDTFALAPDAQAAMGTLIARLDEFAHLSDARIVCVNSERVPMLRGNPCVAFIGQPSVQGPYSPWFTWALAQFCAPLCAGELPDFLVMIDRAVFESLDNERRERVLYHELCHVVPREDEFGIPKLGQDGRLLLKIIPHDFEFFDREVRRYGPDTCELVPAALALADGLRAAQQRRRPRAVA
jgi:hypothetical protein